MMEVYNLVYMAKPIYGGWVSFTAHFAKKTGFNLFKITKKTEKKTRPYGYGIEYKNLSIEDLLLKPNLLITAIDKNYYKYLPLIKEATIVIHDPTELKKPLLDTIIGNDNYKIITIRETMKDLLKDKYNIDSKFIYHPFYPFPKKNKSVSLSRVDFDKHTDIIIRANEKLDNPIEIYGALNDLYVFHKLNKLPFSKYYKGTFPKTFEAITELLSSAKFVVDMSSIKNDGGGTQYTFLEAIYLDCALVLNKKWVNNTSSLFKDKYNCFVVENEEDLIKLLNSNIDTTEVVKNAREILKNHL